MSKARELASLLSNSADLSDGASTGGEFKFTASGTIEANKPLIKKSDNTVEQIKLSADTGMSALSDPQYLDDLSSFQKSLLDVLIDGDYIFVVHQNAYGTGINTIKLTMYSIGVDNLVTEEDSALFWQSYDRGGDHRAWITKTSTSNKYVLSIFDSDESSGDGRISSYGIVNNLNGTFSSSSQHQTPDANYLYGTPRAGARPAQMGQYLVYGIVVSFSYGSTYNNSMYSISTAGSGTNISTAESSNSGIFPTNSTTYPHQSIILKKTDTSGYFLKSNTNGSIEYEYFDIASNGQITDGGNGTISSAGSLATTNYDEFDMVWSDTLNHYVLLTNNATTTRVALYNSGLVFVHARDYPNVGRNDEFYRSLQVDETTGRIYLITHDLTTRVSSLITAVVSDNKVFFLEDETITLPDTGTSDGRPMLSLDEANGKIVYAHEYHNPDTSRENSMLRLVSTASAGTTNLSDGTFIGYSKEAVSDGEYVTVAMNGGTVSLSGLTADTTYFVEADGGIGTSGNNSTCVGKALTSTDLRIDTQQYFLDPDTLGTVGESKVVTSDSSGNVQFSDSDQIRFGTDNDAQIYHNGSTFYLNNTTGSTYLLGDSATYIQGSSITLETNTGENALYYDGTALTCYYNGSAKFQTDSGGIVVTGYVYATSGIAHSGDIDNRILFTTDSQSFDTAGSTRMTINNVGDVDIVNELTAGSYNESHSAVLSSSNATTVNCENGNSFLHTLTENTTFTFSNPPLGGVTSFTMSIEIVQDASASGFTVTWPSSVDWPNATAPTLTATASAKDVFVFTTRDGGVTWYGFTAGQALG